jgi:hypothetical protein
MRFEEIYYTGLCDKCKRNDKYNPATGRSFCDTCYCGSHFDNTVTRTEVKEMLNKIYGVRSRNEKMSYDDIMDVAPKFDMISMDIKNVIFNDPATIVFWADGTKTVVKAVDEPFDKEKGLAMAICKKIFGNKGKYFNYIKKWTEKE